MCSIYGVKEVVMHINTYFGIPMQIGEFKSIKYTSSSFIAFNLFGKNILFDYPAEIYGKNLKIGSMSILLKTKNVTADIIFVTSSISLGIFFVKKNVKIYITKPVYRQLVLRLKELQSYLVSYDHEPENTDDLHDVNDVNLEQTKCNFIFVTYDEMVRFDNFLVEVVSSNSFIGWCNYIIHVQEKRLAYISSFSQKQRISTKPLRSNVDLAILNGLKPSSQEQDLENFSKVCQDNMIKVIPIDISSLFFELFLLLLKTIQKTTIRIYIVFPYFEEFIKIINGCGKWLNKKFNVEQADVLPLNIKNVLYFKTLSEINDIEDDAIVVCSKEEFGIVTSSLNNDVFYNELFVELQKNSNNALINDDYARAISCVSKETGQTVLIDYLISSILSFDLKKSENLFLKKYAVLNVMNYSMKCDFVFNLSPELSLAELRNFYGDPIVVSNTFNPSNSGDIYMVDGKSYFISTKLHKKYIYILKNRQHAAIHNNMLLFDGKIKNKTLICKQNKLKQIFREEYYVVQDTFFFPKLRRKIKLINNTFHISKY